MNPFKPSIFSSRPSQKGSGSIPDLTSHVYKELLQCKSVCGVKSGIDPLPFWLGGEQKMLIFSHVLKSIKWQDFLEEGKNDRKAFRTGAKIHCSEKSILGLGNFKYLRSTAIILPITTQTSRSCRQNSCFFLFHFATLTEIPFSRTRSVPLCLKVFVYIQKIGP